MGIWLTSTNALLAAATVQTGTGSTLSSGYRYETISPINLLANTSFIIGAYYPANCTDGVIANSSQTIASNITYTTSMQTQLSTTQTFSVPTIAPGHNQAFFGPNFQFTASLVPEPSSPLLLALSALGGLAARRRRSA